MYLAPLTNDHKQTPPLSWYFYQNFMVEHKTEVQGGKLIIEFYSMIVIKFCNNIIIISQSGFQLTVESNHWIALVLLYYALWLV